MACDSAQESERGCLEGLGLDAALATVDDERRCDRAQDHGRDDVAVELRVDLANEGSSVEEERVHDLGSILIELVCGEHGDRQVLRVVEEQLDDECLEPPRSRRSGTKRRRAVQEAILEVAHLVVDERRG